MISDTLFDAAEEIRRYERDYPDVYGDSEMKAEIAKVLTAMDALRVALDTVPEHKE